MTAGFLGPAALLLLLGAWPKRVTTTFDLERGLVTRERWYPWRGNEVIFERPLSSLQEVRTEVASTLTPGHGASRTYAAQLVFTGEAPQPLATFRTEGGQARALAAVRAHLARGFQHAPPREAPPEDGSGAPAMALSWAPLGVEREGQSRLELRTRNTGLGRVVLERCLALLPLSWVLLAAAKWLWTVAPGPAPLLSVLLLAGAALLAGLAFAPLLLAERLTCVLDRNLEKLRIERRRLFSGARVEERPLLHLSDALLQRRGDHYQLALRLHSGEELPLMRAANLETALRGRPVSALRRFLASGEPRKARAPAEVRQRS